MPTTTSTTTGGTTTSSFGPQLTTQTPTEPAGYETLAALLRKRAQQRLLSTPSLEGYAAGGIGNINQAYGGAQQGLNASLEARGLGGSPIAGAGETKLQMARAGNIGDFLNTIPQLQRQMQAEDFNLANQFYSQRPMGQTTSQAPTTSSVTHPSQTTTGQTNYGVGETLANLAGQGVFSPSNIKAGIGAVKGIGSVLGLGGAGGLGATTLAPAVGSAIGGAGALGGTAGALGLGSTGAGMAIGGGGAGSAGGSGLLAAIGGPQTLGIGAAIAGGALLAKHYIGQGRRTANKLTGEGGLQNSFEKTLQEIDTMGLPPEQAWQKKHEAYQELVKYARDFANKGGNEAKVAKQMFDTISPLFGETNPLRGV